MKERILKELLARAEKSGCSERTIKAYVENMALPESEDVLTDEYYTSHVNFLTSIGGQISRETALNVEDFKKNYKPSTPPTPPAPKPKPDEPSEFEKEVREFMRASREQSDKAKMDALKERVRKNLIEQGADDEFILDYVFLSKSIDSEKSVDDIVKECRAEYDTQYSRAHANTGHPFAGGNNFGSGKPVELSDKEKAERIKANAEKYCQKKC